MLKLGEASGEGNSDTGSGAVAGCIRSIALSAVSVGVAEVKQVCCCWGALVQASEGEQDRGCVES